eukprot:2015908-Pleurochrysis_carterae.AAC.3
MLRPSVCFCARAMARAYVSARTHMRHLSPVPTRSRQTGSSSALGAGLQPRKLQAQQGERRAGPPCGAAPPRAAVAASPAAGAPGRAASAVASRQRPGRRRRRRVRMQLPFARRPSSSRSA